MKIVCVHCGGQFSITAEQLGGTAPCPSCQRNVVLPQASSPDAATKPEERPTGTNWLESAIAGFGSLVIHMTALVTIALLQSDPTSGGGPGLGEEVLIGVAPAVVLTEHQEEQITVEEVSRERPSDATEALEAMEPTTTASKPEGSGGSSELSSLTPSLAGGDAGGFDLGSARVGSGSEAGGGGWDGMIQSLRRNGLDIVICFDSTGSMTGEIDEVKRQIDRIGTVLMTLVPKTRISVCTYRDQGDEYVVKGFPLSSSVQDVKAYLNRIEAGGGGDLPEAVEEGLYWATMKNQFRPQARKVILLFGDAPPHSNKLKDCLTIATDFRKQHKGIVSTVTCRNDEPLSEFYDIASAGGGEAYLTKNHREIVRELIVLVFGSTHREKVLEAFKLLDK